MLSDAFHAWMLQKMSLIISYYMRRMMLKVTRGGGGGGGEGHFPT